MLLTLSRARGVVSARSGAASGCSSIAPPPVKVVRLVLGPATEIKLKIADGFEKGQDKVGVKFLDKTNWTKWLQNVCSLTKVTKIQRLLDYLGQRTSKGLDSSNGNVLVR